MKYSKEDWATFIEIANGNLDMTSVRPKGDPISCDVKISDSYDINEELVEYYAQLLLICEE